MANLSTGYFAGAGTPGAPGEDGADGDFIYTAFASDNTGTGFSLTPSQSLKWRIEKRTQTQIAGTPVLADFAGSTWIKYIGDDGAPGAAGTPGTPGAAGTPGTPGAAGTNGISAGWLFKMNTATTDADPTTGKISFNNTGTAATLLRLSNNDDLGVSLSTLYQYLRAGDIVDVRSALGSGVSYCSFVLTGQRTSQTNYGTVPIVVIGGTIPSTLNEQLVLQVRAQARSAGLSYQLDLTSTVASTVGAGRIRFNNSSANSVTINGIGSIYISDTTTNGVNVESYVNNWKNGSTLIIQGNSNYSATMGIFLVGTGAQNDLTGYRSVTLTPIAGSTTFANNEYVTVNNYVGYNLDDLKAWKVLRLNDDGDVINHNDQVMNFDGMALQDLLDSDFLRKDVNGQIVDGDGVALSGSPAIDTYANMIGLNTTTYNNFVFVPQSGVAKSGWIADPTLGFSPLNGQYIEARNPLPEKTLTWPATAVTWTAADNGSGFVRLTGTHGLTSAHNGIWLYLMSGGLGWTAGTWHQIKAWIDATHLDLETLYTASMGVPVFAVAHSTNQAVSEAPLLKIALPVCRALTEGVLEYEIEFSSDTALKRIVFRLGGVEYHNFNTTGANLSIPFRHGFLNQNNPSSQRALTVMNGTGYAGNTGNNAAGTPVPVVTSTQATGTAGIIMSVNAWMATAGVTARVSHYTFTIKG